MFRIAIWASAGIQVALFLGFLVRTAILHPFWDMITWIDRFLDLQRDGRFAAYLWAPHNEHRLALIRMLTALDVSAFNASGIPFVVAGTLSLATTTIIVLHVFREGRAFGGALRPLAWFAPMLLLTTANVVDCSIPINTVYPLALVFIVSAVALFDGEAERTRRTDIRRGAAVASAVLSSLANSVGLISWPILFWAAWRGGASIRWRLTIVVIGAFYVYAYLHRLPSSMAGISVEFLTASHLARIATYLLACLGLPLSRAPALHAPALLLGGVLLALGAFAVGRDALDRRPATRLRRLAIGLIMVSLATAALAAIGRADMEAELRVPVRYAVLVAPLHVGLLALAGPLLASWGTAPARTTALLGAGLIACAGLVGLQLLGGVTAVQATDAIAETLRRYDAGARDAGMEKVVFPDLIFADAVMTRLRTSTRDRAVSGRYDQPR